MTPESIYLQTGGDPEEIDWKNPQGVTWCSDQIDEGDPQYIRFTGIQDSHCDPINLGDTLKIEIRSSKDQKPIATYESAVEMRKGQFVVKTPTGHFQWIGGFGRWCTITKTEE